MNNIAPLIRQMRARRGFSQQELSSLTGVSRSTISLLEQGKFNPTLELIGNLTSALKCKLNINIVPEEDV